MHSRRDVFKCRSDASVQNTTRKTKVAGTFVFCINFVLHYLCTLQSILHLHFSLVVENNEFSIDLTFYKHYLTTYWIYSPHNDIYCSCMCSLWFSCKKSQLIEHILIRANRVSSDSEFLVLFFALTFFQFSSNVEKALEQCMLCSLQCMMNMYIMMRSISPVTFHKVDKIMNSLLFDLSQI